MLFFWRDSDKACNLLKLFDRYVPKIKTKKSKLLKSVFVDFLTLRIDSKIPKKTS